ncbi:ICP22 family protein [Actinoplanes sp. RD1]|uniref:hypothetical protein n=1 Tax=Actinoplanes sp. RD1 TaxID=3064538 RepID=UPI0027406A5C|nr:hypothetical protein [Actinoplanes sp. RD1]
MHLARTPAIIAFARGRRRALATPSVALAGSQSPRRPSTRVRRGLVSAGAFGAISALLLPLPAHAAPATCGNAQRYSAQSGSQIMRITELDLDGKRTEEKTGPAVHLGDAKSAMVAQAPVSSAAVARILDAKDDATPESVTQLLTQQAPPTNKTAAKLPTRSADIGPLSLGDGKLSTHARWVDGMACGTRYGEVTRATARLRTAAIADGDEQLAAVPAKAESVSTTALERNGSAATTVAAATLNGGNLELLDGAVRITVKKAPRLEARMSTKDGGEVRYVPAIVEVSGEGVRRARLDEAGDEVEVTVKGASSPDARAMDEADAEDGTEKVEESTRQRAEQPAAEDSGEEKPAGDSDGSRLGPLGRLPIIGGLLSGGKNTPLPEMPDVPEVSEPESAPARGSDAGSGSDADEGSDGDAGSSDEGSESGAETKVTVSLGEVRQATNNHAIAARAAALSVRIAEGTAGKRTKPGYAEARTVSFDVGVLEAAAVSPEPANAATGTAAGGVSGGTAGMAGGAATLPITGPKVTVVAFTGVGLLLAGVAAVVASTRGRRRSRS